MPANGFRAGRTGPMSDVVYLIMRRMRTPLLVLLLVFTVCTVGLSLTPGVDAAGHPAKPMGLFDAFYVISYTATTIGFGEIPAPYSTLQRIWMTASIYLTVIAWYYALVTTLALVQDRAFQTAMRMGRFSTHVQRLREPFYIVCGV
ncbi:MAG: ion channel, partial [Propionibacteriaceae bacterium]|nr:ion channel [Propionibacteriaceae bacterium]